jgi:hypothetical protein
VTTEPENDEGDNGAGGKVWRPDEDDAEVEGRSSDLTKTTTEPE